MTWHCYQPVSGMVGSILGHTGGWGHHVVQGSDMGGQMVSWVMKLLVKLKEKEKERVV